MNAAKAGILLFEVAGKKMLGDPGYSGTFDFPVEYGFVSGSYRDSIDFSIETQKKLCDAAILLEKKGVSVIAGDCGLMVLHQEALANAVNVPVISSSLNLIPIMRTVIGKNKRLGILVAHSELVKKHHIKASGVTDLSDIVFYGMQNQPHFKATVIEGTATPNYNLMRNDVLSAVGELLKENHDIGAILLECSNLASFGHEITQEFSLPVFDINTALRLVWDSVVKQNFAPKVHQIN